MTAQDVIRLYEKKKERYGKETYRYVSELLREIKKLHKQDWQKNPTPGGDHEQSWKGFKGNALEKLILYIINDAVEELGWKIISGKRFEKTKPENLSTELKHVKKNLAIDFGECGFHVPDVDLVIYDAKSYRIVAVISSKATLRERVAQTAYWNLKFKNYELTQHIKVFFLTPDEDGDLTKRYPAEKNRAIVEIDTDGGYVLSETDIEESDKVKMFDKFIDDLKKLLK